MKTKIYIADINSIITEKFNNVTLLYPQAQKDSTKPNCFSAYITDGSTFVAIGTGNEYADELPTFSSWDYASTYAKCLPSGEYIIGIRQSGKKQATPVAKFNI